jgi:hypothetical protein
LIDSELAVEEEMLGLKRKLIYSKMDHPNVYNLGFGDYDAETKTIDDFSRSNNGDAEKVLVTVARTALPFTKNNPNAFIFLTGSTIARTRLYQIGITKYLDQLKEDFKIFGFTEEGLQPFVVGGKYWAFGARRRWDFEPP